MALRGSIDRESSRQEKAKGKVHDLSLRERPHPRLEPTRAPYRTLGVDCLEGSGEVCDDPIKVDVILLLAVLPNSPASAAGDRPRGSDCYVPLKRTLPTAAS
jgi:hypothetical protein